VRLVAGRGEEGSRSDALWGRERKADAGWGSARPRAAGLRCGPRGADREADARAEARGVRAEPRAVKPRDKSFLPTKFFLLFILFSSRDYSYIHSLNVQVGFLQERNIDYHLNG
jgi:hypothetical protein